MPAAPAHRGPRAPTRCRSRSSSSTSRTSSRRRYAGDRAGAEAPPGAHHGVDRGDPGLEPKPGRRFAVNDSRYMVPDVTIQKVGDDYVVVLNEEGIPRLRVNSLYRSLLRRSGDEAKQYVEQKLRSAVWLIKSVEQRQRTLRQGGPEPRELPARLPRQGAALPAARSPCATWATTSACTSRPSAGSPPTSTCRPRRGCSSSSTSSTAASRPSNGVDGVVGVREEDDPGHGRRRGRRPSRLSDQEIAQALQRRRA